MSKSRWKRFVNRLNRPLHLAAGDAGFEPQILGIDARLVIIALAVCMIFVTCASGIVAAVQLSVGFMVANFCMAAIYLGVLLGAALRHRMLLLISSLLVACCCCCDLMFFVLMVILIAAGTAAVCDITPKLCAVSLGVLIAYVVVTVCLLIVYNVPLLFACHLYLQHLR